MGNFMLLPEIIVDNSIKLAWPDTYLGCLYYTVKVLSKSTTLAEYYNSSIVPLLTKQLTSTELVNMPNIREARAAYKSFGIDPGKQRVSSEALYRRLRQKKSLYQINSLVDANNLISLKTGFSLGSYDAECVGQKLVFRLGKLEEKYIAIGKNDISLRNMPVLTDQVGPFGSPTSDSTRAMITLTTQKALTIIYSFSGENTLDEALQLAERYFVKFSAISEIKTFKA